MPNACASSSGPRLGNKWNDSEAASRCWALRGLQSNQRLSEVVPPFYGLLSRRRSSWRQQIAGLPKKRPTSKMKQGGVTFLGGATLPEDIKATLEKGPKFPSSQNCRPQKRFQWPEAWQMGGGGVLQDWESRMKST
ncbi:hypothetical protein HPB47_007371 [Ixodes persulcatus]|uniref:Uncharacterized protein n=1 Tax=Ixodes persulcatus TaxID=34615 RepID=A0AC60P7K4_IXOPE|nr:hypothetical protein HPB47_007371 [Ixodes persulcatus]